MKRCALAMAMTASFSYGGAIDYEFEVIEVFPFQNDNPTVKLNDKGDYFVSVPPDWPFPAQTLAFVDNRRYYLNGFLATDMNNNGQICGFLVRSGGFIGVTWTNGGYQLLSTAFGRAVPQVISDDGRVGGSVNGYDSPCIWQGRTVRRLRAYGAVAGFGPSGLIAGFAYEHEGYSSWYLEGQNFVQMTPGIKVRGIDINGRIFGTDQRGSYASDAVVYDFGKITVLGGWINSSLSDMNDSGVGVGHVGGPLWEDPQAAMWFRQPGGEYQYVDPREFILETGWSKLWLYSVAADGTAIGVAERLGVRWLVRLSPSGDQ
jgi:hypothetical protein